MSDSVVRRVALPGAFLATDGLFETFLVVLDGFGAYPAVIERELERYLPFLATTKVLMAAVRPGVGREQAHEVDPGARGGGGAGAAGGCRRRTTWPTAWRPTTACGSTGPPSTPVLADRVGFVGTALHQVDAFVPAGRGDRRRPPRGRPLPSGTDPLIGAARSPASRHTSWEALP